MDIVIGGTQKVGNNPSNESVQTPVFKKKSTKDRRRNRQDRRRSVRDGVYVFLSVKNDRRSGRDRRNSI